MGFFLLNEDLLNDCILQIPYIYWVLLLRMLFYKQFSLNEHPNISLSSSREPINYATSHRLL